MWRAYRPCTSCFSAKSSRRRRLPASDHDNDRA
jgi:hypothetical protein